MEQLRSVPNVHMKPMHDRPTWKDVQDGGRRYSRYGRGRPVQMAFQGGALSPVIQASS